MRAEPSARSIRLMRVLAAVLALSSIAIGAPPVVGPASGSLLVHGGGRLTGEQIQEFLRLAGGKDGPFVIIPTADTKDDWGAEYIAKSFLTRAGAKNISVVHTRDREVANSDTFIEPLLKARGVWIDGGRQWRLADAYLGTRTQTELQNVLARGGVIGGSSAGATIQGSYMVRGAPEGNHIMMAKGHEEGFGFLRNVAVDQHVIARKRQKDLFQVITARPELLGLGLDEGTAIVVQGDRARVVGLSNVLVYDGGIPATPDGPQYLTAKPGEVVDLASRKLVNGSD